ncbi:alpha/beta hydrolase [Natrinema versiforme]|uniref:Alpha/beta hydrolase n=1 Tax=Natrinema versiforme TaxID=88724 RepID=A0A4P8WMJ6_9EURY|nr:CocE/NonD family hydrolase [Natrinema versiforme]QCS43513.1 alpha/beta hydrolase [Natrinema versiforme]
MSDVLVPGSRDVRGTLEEPAGETDAIVVACPPHPQQGGSRSDPRLVAVSKALCEAGIACLRFDYGPWDDGDGERADVRNAVRWARDEDDLPVGVFGYSFGASLALLAAADVDPAPDAVAVLAPAARLADDLDAAAALRSLSSETPVRVLYGERDTTVDWEPVVERARERGDEVTALPADHFFLGKREAIAEAAAGFFEGELLESGSQ